MWWKRVQSLQQDKIMSTNFNIHVDKSLFPVKRDIAFGLSVCPSLSVRDAFFSFSARNSSCSFHHTQTKSIPSESCALRPLVSVLIWNVWAYQNWNDSESSIICISSDFFRVYVEEDGHVEEDRQVAVFVWYAFEIHRTAKMNKNYANFTISARQ